MEEIQILCFQAFGLPLDRDIDNIYVSALEFLKGGVVI
jgi:hypothetical protein